MDHEVVLKNRVKELRERSRLRQADLAREAGVTRQTILAIEKGRLNPSVVVSLKIARILGEPADYVFYLDRRGGTVYRDAAAPPPSREEPGAIFDFA